MSYGYLCLFLSGFVRTTEIGFLVLFSSNRFVVLSFEKLLLVRWGRFVVSFWDWGGGGYGRFHFLPQTWRWRQLPRGKGKRWPYHSLIEITSIILKKVTSFHCSDEVTNTIVTSVVPLGLKGGCGPWLLLGKDRTPTITYDSPLGPKDGVDRNYFSTEGVVVGLTIIFFGRFCLPNLF